MQASIRLCPHARYHVQFCWRVEGSSSSTTGKRRAPELPCSHCSRSPGTGGLMVGIGCFGAYYIIVVIRSFTDQYWKLVRPLY